jgi:hypothetical protein
MNYELLLRIELVVEWKMRVYILSDVNREENIFVFSLIALSIHPDCPLSTIITYDVESLELTTTSKHLHTTPPISGLDSP